MQTRSIEWCALAAVVGSLSAGCGPVQNAAEGTGRLVKEGYEQVAEATSDGSIDFAIKTALIDDPTIRSRDIHVSTKDGVVTLTGSQPTEAAVHRAEQIAWSAQGVRQVRNQLVVGPP
ncbi:MAG: BON domain-containing protein, partial [Polyangiaceae bacterium]|nr:BON domain-containing protein [Polyangiaceae bacterium]